MHPNQPSEKPPASIPVPILNPKRSLKQPLLLMLWPALLLIGSLLLYALINLLFPDAPPTENNLFGDTHPAKRVVNVLLYLIGAVTVLLGPISFIIGLVLLIKRAQGR